MGRALTLAPDRRLDKLFTDVLGLDAAWLRGVPSNRLAAVARSEKMPPSVFRWELDRLRRFGGDGPMPRGCHLDGSDIRTGVFDVSLGRVWGRSRCCPARRCPKSAHGRRAGCSNRTAPFGSICGVNAMTGRSPTRTGRYPRAARLWGPTRRWSGR